jgi:hypothetical protein
MTETTAADVRPTPDQLAAALRLCAAGGITSVAATELVIAHGHWLRREPFLRRVEWLPADDVYPAGAVPDWPAIQQLLDNDPDRELLYDTTSERGVLGVAAAIGNGWLGNALTSCDSTNVRLIARAVLYAGGES